jgi:hypothetical protein
MGQGGEPSPLRLLNPSPDELLEGLLNLAYNLPVILQSSGPVRQRPRRAHENMPATAKCVSVPIHHR